MSRSGVGGHDDNTDLVVMSSRLGVDTLVVVVVVLVLEVVVGVGVGVGVGVVVVVVELSVVMFVAGVDDCVAGVTVAPTLISFAFFVGPLLFCCRCCCCCCCCCC